MRGEVVESTPESAVVDVEPAASVLVNRDRNDWRSIVAKRLRLWSQQLDGRLTLAVEFRSTHPVDAVRLRACLDRGMACAADHAAEAATESARLGKRHTKRSRA